jgi:hypothetical protein
MRHHKFNNDEIDWYILLSRIRQHKPDRICNTAHATFLLLFGPFSIYLTLLNFICPIFPPSFFPIHFSLFLVPHFRVFRSNDIGRFSSLAHCRVPE